MVQDHSHHWHDREHGVHRVGDGMPESDELEEHDDEGGDSIQVLGKHGEMLLCGIPGHDDSPLHILQQCNIISPVVCEKITWQLNMCLKDIKSICATFDLLLKVSPSHKSW